MDNSGNIVQMQPPMIEAILETGVDWNSAIQVIERRLIETGKGYSKNKQTIVLARYAHIMSSFQAPRCKSLQNYVENNKDTESNLSLSSGCNIITRLYPSRHTTLYKL